MGYVANGSIEDLFGQRVEDEIDDYLERLARAAQSRWLDLAKQFTPVADIHESDLADRGREPGTLRKRWRKVGGVMRLGDGRFVVEIENWDPIAAYVEYPTQPHIIRAKGAKALRFRADGDLVFAAFVNHPGTHGSFMLARSAAALIAELPEIEAQVRRS